jgi:Protein of unknown function (DUF5818)
MLKNFKRDLSLFSAITCFVIVCALAWGKPFVGTDLSAVHAQVRSARVFEGFVLRHGEQLLLRDTSGQEIPLDAQQQALPFVGKTVTVTGNLEGGSKSIHIVHIEPAA